MSLLKRMSKYLGHCADPVSARLANRPADIELLECRRLLSGETSANSIGTMVALTSAVQVQAIDAETIPLQLSGWTHSGGGDLLKTSGALKLSFDVDENADGWVQSVKTFSLTDGTHVRLKWRVYGGGMCEYELGIAANSGQPLATDVVAYDAGYVGNGANNWRSYGEGQWMYTDLAVSSNNVRTVTSLVNYWDRGGSNASFTDRTFAVGASALSAARVAFGYAQTGNPGYIELGEATVETAGTPQPQPEPTPNPDPDDQISEARHLVLPGQTADGIAVGSDVDMYKVELDKGDLLAIDLDRRKGRAADTYVRVFNGRGKILAQTGSSFSYLRDPESSVGADQQSPFVKEPEQAFLEYKAYDSGIYYIGVSSEPNDSYNPISGSGDREGRTGTYSIAVSKIISRVETVKGHARGAIHLPNRSEGFTSTITPLLIRIGEDPAIEQALATDTDGGATWIVIHGRADGTSPKRKDEWTRPMASLLAKHPEVAQALVLDWSQGARDNAWALGLDGARWIPYVGHWLSNWVEQSGIPSKTVFLVGHSWGSWVAYEAAKQLGGVGGIVALDPATSAPTVDDNGGYDASVVDFNRAARRSWAFEGGGLFGSSSKALSAMETFRTIYGDYPVGSKKHTFANELLMHAIPKMLFRAILLDNIGLSEPAARYSRQRRMAFNLSHFMDPNPSDYPWDFSKKYEGEFVVRTDFDAALENYGDPSSVAVISLTLDDYWIWSFRYRRGGEPVVI